MYYMPLFCKAALQRRGKGKEGDKNRLFNGSLDVSARWQGLKRWGKSWGETETLPATLHNEPSTLLKLCFEEHYKITFFSFFLRQRSTVIPGQGLLLPFVQSRIFARESQMHWLVELLWLRILNLFLKCLISWQLLCVVRPGWVSVSPPPPSGKAYILGISHEIP